jgi:hypothetical protein
LFRGIVAGVAGAAVQAYFFKATAKIMPEQPKGVFTPPEPEQKDELATHTVARRAVEKFAQQGPLTKQQKQLGGEIVHYSFGGLWGGLYGLTMESFPSWKGPIATAAYSSIVWMVGDNIILPFFRLSAWPQAYPAKNHLYAWVAHLAYGAGLWLTYTSLSTGTTLAGVAYYGARYGRRYGKFVPKPIAKAVVKPAARFIAKKPVRDFVAAML